MSSNPKKRKTLHEYFRSSAGHPIDAVRVVDTPSKLYDIPGLSLIPNFISAPEESTLLSFLSAQQWRSDLSRRTMHYGGTYCLMPSRSASPTTQQKTLTTIVNAPPIPAELLYLIDRMVHHNLYAPTVPPGFCIVNEYRASQGISAHVENFRFGEPVCALTLGDGDFMRFHELEAECDGSVRSGKAARAPRTGRRVDVWLPKRSLLVMGGEARKKWQHEICRGRKGRVGLEWRRVSVTFRVEKEGSPREPKSKE